MTTFDDREKAFEKKYVHDEELAFKINARRNKLLGLWAAERMGKSLADAEVYARQVVLAEYEEAGDDDVFRKISRDLEAAGAPVNPNGLRACMDALLEEARRQLTQA